MEKGLEKKMPRGLRLLNPLNIRKSGDVFEGEVVPSTDTAFKILRTYIGKYGLDTIRKMITRWAPPEDGNHTENYIKAVSERSGIPADDIIYPDNREMMTRVVAAMSYVENGVEADMADVIKGLELL